MIDPASPDFSDTPAGERRPEFAYAPAELEARPCVSIITPFLDTDPSVFEQTVRSVQRQSLQQWEWLIVDDGSTRADSRAALESLAASDARVRLLRHDENRGLPAARNTAVAHVRTDFVLQLDSDDLVEPTATEKWLWFLISHPEYAFVKGFTVGFDQLEYLWPRGFHEGKAFLAQNLVAPTSLVRREVFEAVGGYDEELRAGLEDWEFWLRCAASGFWGATVPEYLDWYRRKGRESERWANWSGGEREQELLRSWRERYPQLWRGGFPKIRRSIPAPAELELDEMPLLNVLVKPQPRLLLIVPWAAVGGADKFNVDLVAQLARRGWESTVVTTLSGDHSWLPLLEASTPDVFALSRFLKPVDYPRFLAYLIRSRRPDAILIAGSQFGYVALPHLRRVAAGAGIADYCHLVEEQWLGGGHPRLSVDNRLLLDLHLTTSEQLKAWLVDRGVEPARAEVCYIDVEPVETDREAVRAGLDVGPDHALVVYPCRICEQKQPQVFAATLRELRRRRTDFTALVVGEGPLLPWLKRYVQRNRLGPHVRFLGAQPNDRTRELIGAADCVFLPSKYEGIALTLYEALAAGVPVVAADVGGQRELVTPDCGILVERADRKTEVRRYADALEELLADPERRRALGEAGRVRIREHFTLDRMGRRMDDLLRHAQELARSDPRPTPGAEEARRAAVEAVRLVAADPTGPLYSAGPLPWRLRLALIWFLMRVGHPVYRLSLRLGFHSVERLRERVVDILLPRGT